MPVERVATGVPPVDRLLGGGLEPDGITELYGEGGTGKSLLCLEATKQVARQGRWVFYVDTEGLSVGRLEAIAGADLSPILGHLLLSTPKDLAAQGKAVSTACTLAREGKRPVGLLVLDSATLYYRLTLGTAEEDEARTQLERQLADLLSTALAVEIPVLITNQVWRSVNEGTLEPIGGTFVSHVAKTILKLERLPGGRRRVTLTKHRSLPEASTEFRITPTGLV